MPSSARRKNRWETGKIAAVRNWGAGAPNLRIGPRLPSPRRYGFHLTMTLHRHGHDPGHSHGHARDHAPVNYGRAFAVGVSLNLGFVLVEGAAGLVSGSVALVADASHNLSDVLGLLMAWAAYALSARPASRRFTYGLRSSSILAALLNAILLLVASGAITLAAVQRFLQPAPIASSTVIIVAAIGILVNLGTALLFLRGRRDDLNIRGAFLHMAADAAVSAGVLGGGLLVSQTGLLWIDPVISLIIVAVIVGGTWGLFRDSLRLSLHGVPGGIDAAEVEARLGALPGVSAVHHVHIWPMSTTEIALTAHLVMPQGDADDEFLADTARLVAAEFGIGHATFQVERGECADDRGCDDPHHVEGHRHQHQHH